MILPSHKHYEGIESHIFQCTHTAVHNSACMCVHTQEASCKTPNTLYVDESERIMKN